jgi:alkylhydroperoxidase/carboxymuconolactone decarboxylase family protein YurZ
MIDKSEFEKYLLSLRLSGENDLVRLLSILSAAIAVCSEELTETILIFLRKNKFNREAIYETILQSYLFLGFPRMIEAAIVYNRIFGDIEKIQKIDKISLDESEFWFADGIKLCRRVYGANYEILKSRFEKISPEIFRWMVIEGYGKVLSRPRMTNIERELAEVAALIVDGRERQLLSHIMGSLNVGAKIDLIRQVNEDIKPLAGNKNFELAEKNISAVLNKYETKK